mmetsp:Transcript_13004/g.25238  ORF Transcript_13004/g.25238 Transcript_13004/m.25238 type:complete len:257 (+) Transcript_13004:128-898(+)
MFVQGELDAKDGPRRHLREAAKRAESGDRAETFVGNAKQGTPATLNIMLPEVVSENSEENLSKALKKAIAILRQKCDLVQQDRDQDQGLIEKQVERQQATSQPDDDKAVTCIYLLAREALRKRTSRETMRTDLREMGFDEVFANKFSEGVYILQRDLETKAFACRVGHPHIDDLAWQIIPPTTPPGSGETGRSLEAKVHLTIRLSDGSTRSLVADTNALQELRYATAKALEQVHELEAHPMMRIMASIEADERQAL